MKLIDLIKSAILKMKRDKENKFYYSIMILCSLLIMISLAIYTNYYKFTNDLLTKNPGFRTLNVPTSEKLTEKVKEQILKINNIVDVYDSSYDGTYLESSDFKTDKLSGTVSLNYGEKNVLPMIIFGRTFNENETGVAICPINFYPDDRADEFLINKDLIIDGKTLLNSSFNIEYYKKKIENDKIINAQKFNKNFKIVGLYKSETIMNGNNKCYVPEKDIKDIVEASLPQGINDFTSSYYVVVDNLNNINKVQAQLEKMGFNDIVTKNYINSNLLNIIKIVCVGISSLILCAIIVLVSSFIKKKLDYERFNMGILRASGYEKKDLIKLYIMESSLINFIIYIFGALFFLLIFYILKNYIFSVVEHLGIEISLNTPIFIFSFIIIMTLSLFIESIYIFKSLNEKVINLLRSKE